MKFDNKMDWSLLLLRVVFGGFMLINHGWSKCLKLLADGPVSFPDPIGWGAKMSLGATVFAEGVCALLITIGGLTRWASIPAFITMIVAAFVVHAEDTFADKEHALLFGAVYLVLAIMGAGRYSIDGWWNNRKMI